MTPFIAFALAGLSLAGVPAEPRGVANPAPAERQAARPNPDRNYCFRYEVTGSILRYKTCKTFGEWMKEGVDPTAKP